MKSEKIWQILSVVFGESLLGAVSTSAKLYYDIKKANEEIYANKPNIVEEYILIKSGAAGSNPDGDILSIGEILLTSDKAEKTFMGAAVQSSMIYDKMKDIDSKHIEYLQSNEVTNQKGSESDKQQISIDKDVIFDLKKHEIYFVFLLLRTSGGRMPINISISCKNLEKDSYRYKESWFVSENN